MRLWVLLIWMMGGTAVQAQDAVRLGVFGTVERVDPLIVAGLEITLPEAVPVISPLGVGQKLALGDTVAIAATLSRGDLLATRVLEIYAIAGPVSSVAAGNAVIMGSTVHVPPDAVLKEGRWVAVSGLWSGDAVITTKLRPLDGGGFGHLTGAVDSASLRVGASELHDVQIPTDGLGAGVWMLSGTPRAAGLQVRLMSQGVFGGQVKMALWQGYASAPIASQTYMIHGTGITGTAHDAEMPAAGDLVERCVIGGRVLHAAPEGLELAFDALGCATRAPAE